ncbi:MAG: permease [Candidatus Hecatellaceae archaeon]
MPEKFPQTVSAIGFYLAEVLWILPGVLILAGLLLVWFPRELVVKYLGETSGAKGFLLSIVLGMLPTGPAYLAFPIAAALLKRGARIANVVIFLSAWSCIKLPQELVELQFLGLEFMTVRLNRYVSYTCWVDR